MIELDWNDLSLEDIQEALSSYAMEVYRLKKLVKQQSDTIRRLDDCRDEYKRQAGFSTNTSFDIVWEKTLEKAIKYDKSIK
jgi:hypothetical protein